MLLLPEAENDCIACSMQRCFQETFLEMIEKAFFLINACYYIVVCVYVKLLDVYRLMCIALP